MSGKRLQVPTEELVTHYLAGETTTELAAIHNATPAAIRNRLKAAGVTMRPARRRSLHDTVAANVISAYGDGMNMADIAREYGVSHSTVQRTLAASAVRIRPHGLRGRTIRVPTNPVALGYLCGLFDGEGNLQFRDKHAGRSLGCKLSITSTTPGMMLWLVQNVGGSVLYNTGQVRMNRGWLPIGCWNLYRAQDVALLLTVMLPYLIVKKEQAQSALRLFGSRFEVHVSPPTITQSKQGSLGGR